MPLTVQNPILEDFQLCSVAEVEAAIPDGTAGILVFLGPDEQVICVFASYDLKEGVRAAVDCTEILTNQPERIAFKSWGLLNPAKQITRAISLFEEASRLKEILCPIVN